MIKLSGNRRRPYMARKTVDWKDNGQPKYAYIGYYATRAEAMIALAAYNADPYDLTGCTFEQLFERFREQIFPTLGTSLQYAHRAAYKYCSALYDIEYRKIKKPQMQRCVDNCGKSYATKANIKNLFVALDKFAFDNDLITKMYSTNLTVGERETVKTRSLWTDEEVRKLWANRGPVVDEILLMLYTGMRESEMLTLECANIDITEWTLTGGLKTQAGKNRVIPIHPDIRELVKSHLSAEKYLFSAYNPPKTPHNERLARKSLFDKAYRQTLQRLGMAHTTHDCRHTFRSKLDSAGANKVCIDLLMGHKSKDIGERVYTHKTLEELRRTIDLLSY